MKAQKYEVPPEKVITGMTITYANGDVKEIERGAYIDLANGESIDIGIVSEDDSDVFRMVDAVMLLGYQLGMFDDVEVERNESGLH